MPNFNCCSSLICAWFGWKLFASGAACHRKGKERVSVQHDRKPYFRIKSYTISHCIEPRHDSCYILGHKLTLGTQFMHSSSCLIQFEPDVHIMQIADTVHLNQVCQTCTGISTICEFNRQSYNPPIKFLSKQFRSLKVYLM